MDNTPNLGLPYIIAAQAQKHVTHNEALRGLDALVQLAVLDKDLTGAPASPSDGDRYIVAASATGDWVGKENNIAAFQDNAWAFHAPIEGWRCWISDEDKLNVFDGTDWTELSAGGGGGSETSAKFGVNATADTTNRLSVKSDAVLFSHDDVTPGSGDIRTKLNKDAAGDTASFLFQTGFSGRAEIGLTGDDDFHFKVSPDGSTWHDGILIDKDTGACTFPNSSLGGGSGTVKQIIGVKMITPTLITSASDTGTGLAASLTPANTTNEILVRVAASIGGDFWNVVPKVSIYRKIGAAAATKVWPSASGTYINHQYLADSAANSGLITYSCAMEFSDNPATIEAVTYELRLASNGTHNACMNRRNDGAQKGESFITLEEYA